MPRTQLPKKWQTHPGNNRFFCSGRCMMAKDTGIFWFTCALIVGTSALFFGFDCVYLTTKLSPAVPVVGGMLVVFVLGTFFRTGCTDPGILPRSTDAEAAFLEQQYEPERDENGQVRNQPRLQELTVAGQSIKVKFCYTCRMFRPPRASHCSVCNNCVDRFDHHCPWVGNCIGVRNYRYFYQFILSLALLAAYIFAFAVTTLVLRSQESTFVTAMKDAPARYPLHSPARSLPAGLSRPAWLAASLAPCPRALFAGGMSPVSLSLASLTAHYRGDAGRLRLRLVHPGPVRLSHVSSGLGADHERGHQRHVGQEAEPAAEEPLLQGQPAPQLLLRLVRTAAAQSARPEVVRRAESNGEQQQDRIPSGE